MDAAFECSKNRYGGFEYPFYITTFVNEGEVYSTSPHWHYHFELLYFPYGNAKVFVGNKGFDISRGDLVLINPCEVHSISIDPGVSSKQFIIGFDTELLNAASNMNFEFKYLLPQAVDINPDHRVIKISSVCNVVSLLEEMNLEYLNREIGFELAVTSNLYKLITCILRYLQKNGLTLTMGSDLHKNKTAKLIKVLNYIDKHFNENITAAYAAEMCFLSYSHFSKIFKNIMHTTFIQYLNIIRIRKAESLLLDEEKSITQIALETGFTDVSYFIKQFKQYKGASPKQYRGLLIKQTDKPNVMDF